MLLPRESRRRSIALVYARRPQDTRVVVAMSGGVDSSVVAAMLAEEGYEVVGVTLQLYDHGAATARKGACCAGRDIHDARRVAEAMGFPHYVLDYEDRFRAGVIDEFADAYLAGATPVPCIRCNERVKFRDLLETARDLEADCMATGHYVRRVDGAARAGAAPRGRPGARPELLPVRDHARAARLPALPARRARLQGRDPGARGALRAAGRRQARQPGHLLRAERHLCRGDREAAARGGRARRDRRISTAGCSGRTRASSATPSASGAASASAAASRSSWCGSTPRRGGSSSARARRWPAARSPVARGELARRRRRSRRRRRTAGRSRCGCARRGRRRRRGCIPTGRTRARVELLAPRGGRGAGPGLRLLRARGHAACSAAAGLDVPRLELGRLSSSQAGSDRPG